METYDHQYLSINVILRYICGDKYPAMKHEILETKDPAVQKETISLELQPIWEMLRYNKRKLNLKEWLFLIDQVKEGIVHHPDEYVNVKIDKPKVFRNLIDKIFEEFVFITLHEEDKRIKAYKRKFDRALRHIKVLLLNKKEEMTTEEWEALVMETKLTVLKNPGEFFCFDLPMKEITNAAILQVFEGFAHDQKIRAIQSNQFYLRNFQ